MSVPTLSYFPSSLSLSLSLPGAQEQCGEHSEENRVFSLPSKGLSQQRDDNERDRDTANTDAEEEVRRYIFWCCLFTYSSSSSGHLHRRSIRRGLPGTIVIAMLVMILSMIVLWICAWATSAQSLRPWTYSRAHSTDLPRLYSSFIRFIFSLPNSSKEREREREGERERKTISVYSRNALVNTAL